MIGDGELLYLGYYRRSSGGDIAGSIEENRDFVDLHVAVFDGGHTCQNSRRRIAIVVCQNRCGVEHLGGNAVDPV